MKTKLDRYSLLIISKYFNTSDDYINVMLTNKKFEYFVDMFHFNPIPIDKYSLKLFTGIETQFIYNKYDDVIPNLYNYIVWYSSNIKTIEYFERQYHIRPIFKKLYVDNSFISSGKKKEGDLLFYLNFPSVGYDNSGPIDCSDFIGFKDSSFCYFQLMEIKLGKHINTIPSYCFNGCPLNSIDLSFVTKLEQSFVGCSNLTSITLSKHLEIMDIFCFRGCSFLKTITITDNSKEFKLDLSYELYQVMKNNGITCTGNIWVMSYEKTPTDIDCKIIKTEELFNQEIVKINSLQIVHSNLFCDCKVQNIKQINFSSNVVSLCLRNFHKLRSLERINLENVRGIGYDCFGYSLCLKELNISNLRYLGEKAFHGCLNLTSVTYSSHLNYIPNNCFDCCFKLQTVQGIENVKQLCVNCFNKCKKLKFDKIPLKVYRICNSNGSRFNIKSIDKDCPILYFECGCFKGNTTLESIHIRKSNFFNKIVGVKAFAHCTTLKEVKLEGIKNIDLGCFRDCYSLSTIKLPSTLKTIGKYCFENCWSLKEILIPPNLKSIGKDAFLSCKSLTKVDFENGKANIQSNLFNHCPLKEINLINGNQFKGCFSYEHYLMLKIRGIDVNMVEYTRSDRRKYGNIIPECCCRIGDRTFEECSMGELTIPSNIKKLGLNCFNKCRNLNKIYVGTELKKDIKVEVHNNYDSNSVKFPFATSIYVVKNYRYKTLFVKLQKDETIPIEIIEI